MSNSLIRIWEQLAAQSSSGGGYRLHLLNSRNRVRVFAAYEESKCNYGFIVEMPSQFKPQNLAQQRSRKIDIVDRFEGLPAGMDAVGLLLKDSNFLDLFTILVNEIVREINSAATTEETCKAAVRCISRWRLFLEKKGLPLSEQEVRGLIGELVVLNRLSLRYDSRTALEAWKGPLNAIRDFELPDYSVEVKTCVPSEGAVVSINFPEQLDAQDIRPVFLAVVTLAKTQAEGLSLPEFAETAGQIFNDSEEAAVYYDKLASAGYLSSHAQFYSDRYGISDCAVFRVMEGFPRIPSSHVPGGVLHVRFDISVAALRPFRVEETNVLGRQGHLER